MMHNTIFPKYRSLINKTIRGYQRNTHRHTVTHTRAYTRKHRHSHEWREMKQTTTPLFCNLAFLVPRRGTECERVCMCVRANERKREREGEREKNRKKEQTPCSFGYYINNFQSNICYRSAYRYP